MITKAILVLVCSAFASAHVDLDDYTCQVTGSVIHRINHMTGRLLEKQGETLDNLNANFVLAPLSIINFIASMRVGSSEETREEFERQQLLNSPQGDSYYADTMKHIQNNSHSAVFFDQSVPLAEGYRQTMTSNYFTNIRTDLDFTSVKDARNKINAWAQRKSVSLSEDIFKQGEINSTMKMVSANVFNYKMDLRLSTKTERIFEETFYANETSYDVPMHSYAATGHYVNTCPYDCGEEARYPDVFKFDVGEPAIADLYVFVENNRLRRHDIEHFFCQYFETWLDLPKNDSAKVKMPSIKLDFVSNLREVLGQHFGLNKIFQPDAQLRGVSTQNIQLGRMHHQVSIHFVPTDCDPLTSENEFIVSKPFVYVVVHRASKAILIAGRTEMP